MSISKSRIRALAEKVGYIYVPGDVYIGMGPVLVYEGSSKTDHVPKFIQMDVSWKTLMAIALASKQMEVMPLYKGQRGKVFEYLENKIS